MRKSGENCLLQGNAFADAQKMMKIADFYAHIPVGVLQENQVHDFFHALSALRHTPLGTSP